MFNMFFTTHLITTQRYEILSCVIFFLFNMQVTELQILVHKSTSLSKTTLNVEIFVGIKCNEFVLESGFVRIQK